MPYTDEELLAWRPKKSKEDEEQKPILSDEELLAWKPRAKESIAPQAPDLADYETQAADVMSRQVLGFSAPTIAGGVLAGGAQILSMAYRPGELLPEKWGGKFSRERADWYANYSDALVRATKIAGNQGIIKEGLTSALSSGVPMLAAGPLGGPAMIGMSAVNQANQSVAEGRKEGLTGLELSAYAGRQGALEGAISGAMYLAGFGGMNKVLPGFFSAAKEGTRQAVNATYKEMAKKVGKETAKTWLQETTEENVTSLLQIWNAKYSGVDKSEWSLKQVANSFYQTTAATTWMTAGLGGPIHLGKAIEAGKAAAIEKAITDTALRGEIPTRKQWKEWGLDPEQGKTAKGRQEGVQQAKEQLQQQYEPQQPVAEETRQEAPQETVRGIPYVQEIAGQLSTEPELAQVHPEEVAASLEQAIEPMQPGTEAAHPITSIKNEIVTELREGRGEAAVEGVAPETTEEWLNTAEQQIRDDPSFATRLVEELIVQPRSISDTDTAALQLHYRNLNNQFALASDELTAARQSNDPMAVKEAEAKSKFLLGEVQKTEEASKAAGREWGRAGVARQLELKADYSPATLIRRAAVAKGNLLSEAETTQIKEFSTKVTILQKELDGLNAARSEQDTATAVDAAIKQSKPKARFQKRIPTLKKIEAQKHVQDAWAEFKRTLGPPTEGLIGGESGALNVDAVAAGLKLAKAYGELGVTTFTEFLESAKTFVGDVTGVTTDTLRHSWEQARAAGYIPTLDIDPTDPKAITRTAKKLTRSLVENGITEREAVVDGVYDELKQVIPDLTRRQVMDAISGYGQYSELTKGEVEATIRDIRGQLQQLAKLEDMQQGQPPKKTGVERRTPSDTERRLIQQVNESKRRGGFNVTDPATQLKSALDASKTAIQNRISDLSEEIQTGKRIVKEKTEVIPDKELKELRQKRDELRKAHDELFPRQPLTQEQLIARTSKALDSAITQLESELKEGTLYPQKALTKVSSPEIEAKRNQLEALRSQRQELRNIVNPKLTPEERQLSAYKTRLHTRLSDLQRRISDGDFTKVQRKETPLDKEATDLKWQIKQEQDKYKALEERWRKEQLTGLAKAWDVAGEASNLSRASMTSFDISGVGRQGGPASKAHPVLAYFALVDSLKALGSKEGEFRIMEQLRNDRNYQLGQMANLATTVTEGKLTQQEEAYRGTLASKIPGIAASERAYVTFLNSMRQRVFSQMVDSLGGKDLLTLDEAKILANCVNVFTGRGHFAGDHSTAAQLMATYFFSPRLVAARFQLILGQPLWYKAGKGSWKVRKAIAKEYARYLVGETAFQNLLGLFGYMTAGDDDREKPITEWNPLSANFGKTRFGGVVLDTLSGLSQNTVLLTRIGPSLLSLGLRPGLTKKSTGEIVPITGENVPFKGLTAWDAITRFLRSKLAPIPASLINVTTGKNIIGEPANALKEAAGLFTPLAFRDIYDVMHAKGISRKVVLGMLGQLGMSAQYYEDATPEAFARKISEHPQLRGYNKAERKAYDYTTEVGQIIQEAKKRGLKSSDLAEALIPYMRKAGNKEETVGKAVSRLHARFNADE